MICLLFILRVLDKLIPVIVQQVLALRGKYLFEGHRLGISPTRDEVSRLPRIVVFPFNFQLYGVVIASDGIQIVFERLDICVVVCVSYPDGEKEGEEDGHRPDKAHGCVPLELGFFVVLARVLHENVVVKLLTVFGHRAGPEIFDVVV